MTAINGQSLTIKPDNGAPITFTVSDGARILETQPGAKTLAGATPIPLSGIAVGDRILAVLHPSSTASEMTATTLVAMKAAAVAQRQEAEETEWRHSVGGLVKAADTTTGTITIASGPRTIIIHTTPQTTFRRYSSDSIKFSDAQPSTLAEIHAGDQLRARGERSADGGEVAADEIVSGTFRNIAGTVVSVDPAGNSVTVTDLATKKPVVIHITAESQMHKLPEQMAQFLAMRLKQPAEGQSQEHSQNAAASPSRAGSQQPGGGSQRGGDLSQMLQRTPTVQLADLHKGDALMIVATQGTPGSATVVTLLAGVEPILTASPAASQSMFSASWNVGGGGDAGTGEEGTP